MCCMLWLLKIHDTVTTSLHPLLKYISPLQVRKSTSHLEKRLWMSLLISRCSEMSFPAPFFLKKLTIHLKRMCFHAGWITHFYNYNCKILLESRKLNHVVQYLNLLASVNEKPIRLPETVKEHDAVGLKCCRQRVSRDGYLWCCDSFQVGVRRHLLSFYWTFISALFSESGACRWVFANGPLCGCRHFHVYVSCGF